jgi:hypothetical protein
MLWMVSLKIDLAMATLPSGPDIPVSVKAVVAMLVAVATMLSGPTQDWPKKNSGQLTNFGAKARVLFAPRVER